jgi:hypothetical protein
MLFTEPSFASQDADLPMIARWFQDKRAAVSLRFDDSRASHVKYAIPMLNQYGIKATFMINPGINEYVRNKGFWENEVPKMGHRLGNHTMHHEGADNLETADFEIGEVSRLLWRLYPDKSQLNVFASGGGGVKWGGKLWKEAEDTYKQLVKKYLLIDLYDGSHPSKPYNSDVTPEEYCRKINDAIVSGRHSAFHFHNVGEADLKDRVHKLLKGVSLDIKIDTFKSILDCVVKYNDRVWVAPLIDILKYKIQYKHANLSLKKRTTQEVELILKLETDKELYDHDLTLIIPKNDNRVPVTVTQNGNAVKKPLTQNNAKFMVEVAPINSIIVIQFE